MKLTDTQREVLLLAAESGGRPSLPAPEHLVIPVDGLMREGMLALDESDRVTITELGRAARGKIQARPWKKIGGFSDLALRLKRRLVPRVICQSDGFAPLANSGRFREPDIRVRAPQSA
jgi:hypothetical protein